MPSAPLPISYSQIAVFDGQMDSPFNDWTEQHAKQGFSWRPGSVSFKTLIHSGPAVVMADVSSRFVARSDSVRTIVVPFEVTPGANTEVATIEAAISLDIMPGKYSLFYETGGKNAAHWIRLTFVPDGGRDAAVLVQDDGLTAVGPLLMYADPA